MQSYLNNLPRQTPSGRIYIFSGLIKCHECGYSLCGHLIINNRHGKKYYYKGYRCANHYSNGKCSSTKSIHETVMEKYLLDNLLEEADKYILEINTSAEQPDKIDVTALREELNRLNYMFQKNRISTDDYEKQYEILEKKIIKAEKDRPNNNTSHLLDLKKVNLKEYYYKLNDENKRAFWRKYIDKIIFSPGESTDLCKTNQ